MKKLTALIVLVVSLGISCAPASDVRVLQEQVDFLHAQVLGLQDKVAAADVRSCKAEYLAWFAAVRVGVVQDQSVDYTLPGCPTWKELNR